MLEKPIVVSPQWARDSFAFAHLVDTKGYQYEEQADEKVQVVIEEPEDEKVIEDNADQSESSVDLMLRSRDAQLLPVTIIMNWKERNQVTAIS